MSDEQHQKPHLRVVKAIDEALPAGGAPDDAVSGAAAAADPAPLNEKAGTGPVSYTHLTLPTID